MAKRALPAYDGVQAELKLYSGPPHITDQHDAELTSLSPTIGALCPATHVLGGRPSGGM